MIRRSLCLVAVVFLQACASDKPFYPRSQYPPDPWVKGYAGEKDCIGGEKLSAVKFDLPKYPNRAYRSGRQGWVILKLDVAENGIPENIDIERSVPDGLFEDASVKSAKAWVFAPPVDGALKNCRVLLRFRGGDVYLGS